MHSRLTDMLTYFFHNVESTLMSVSFKHYTVLVKNWTFFARISKEAGLDAKRLRADLIVQSHERREQDEGRVAPIILEKAERGCLLAIYRSLSRSTFQNPKTRGIAYAHLAIQAAAGGTPALRFTDSDASHTD